MEKRNKVYKFNEPIICNSQYYELPDNLTDLFCEECQPGFSHKPISEGSAITTCQACESGHYLDENNACQECRPGSIPNKILKINRWEKIPDEFSTKCESLSGGDCSTNTGWVAKETYLTTNPNLDPLAGVFLSKLVTILQTKGGVEFSYELMPNTDGIFNFYLNGIIKFSVEEAGRYETIVELSTGINQLEWVFVGRSHGEARLYEISITGSNEGGASSCTQCSKGSISLSDHSRCVECTPGYTSNFTNSECIKCEDNTYNYFFGSECLKCPENTYSNQDRTACLGSDYMILTNNTYYLRNLTGNSGVEQAYNGGLCSRDNLKMYCHQTFYGPIPANSSQYYISILNPSIITLPDFQYLYESSLGYAFALETLDDPKLKNKTNNICFKENTAIVNAGRKVLSPIEHQNGFSLVYTDGDVCNDSGDRYRTMINFECNKREGGGWPILKFTNKCSTEFIWKSRWGCRVCREEELVVVKTICMNGKRSIEKMEGKDCILPSDFQIESSHEDCSVSGEILYTVPVIIGLAALILVLMITVLISYFCCKFKNRYQQLVESR